MATTATSEPHDPASHASAHDAALCPKCSTALPAGMLRNLSLSRQDDGPASASTDSFEVLSSPPPRVSSRPPQILTSGGPVDPDKAEKSATSVALTPHEIDRWYRIASSAGINVVLPNSPRSAWSQSQPSKSPVKSPLSAAPRSALPATGPASLTAAAPIPLIPAPPRSSGPRSAGGLRSFWKRGKKEDSGDEDNEDTPSPGSGYSRLGAPDPEEDESEDDKEGEKVFSPKTPSTADTSTPTPTGPPKAGTKSQGEGEGEASPSATDNTPTATPVPTIHVPEGTEATEKDKAPASAPPLTVLEEDLKAVLAEVLPRVWVLNAVNQDLVTSHSSLRTALETDLQIAKSNLMMASANTEMMEDELKRLRAQSAASSARSSLARVSGEERSRSRPTSIQAAPASSSSGFGFWKTDDRDEELRMLREELETLRSGRQAQDDEIEELRTGKKAIEAELEGLSQALFEEANNMVADERRKRAEVEETLREVKEEREALRQTVKVLGGRVQTPLPGTPVGELTEADAMRNLDQPYEALRRGIRHAIDGPSPAPSEAESDDDATPGENAAEADAAAVAAVAAAEVPETRTRSNTVTTLRANGQPAQPMYAAEPNPWD